MSCPLFDLTGKVAIVTGSTRGLGRAIAEAYAQAGARVMLSSENAADCARAEAEMKEAGHEVASAKCDVTVLAEQEALVEKTVSLWGGLDVLVANAGITDTMNGLLGPTEADYQRVMEVNLHSIVRLCRIVVPHLKQRGGGSIVLMSSLSALRGNKVIGPYALTKAALAQLARNLALEFGPDNIRANAIAPGFIATDLAAPAMADKAFMTRRMQNTPLRRPGTPQEVAGPAVFLASPGGAFMSGQTLVIDGGTLITDGN